MEVFTNQPRTFLNKLANMMLIHTFVCVCMLLLILAVPENCRLPLSARAKILPRISSRCYHITASQLYEIFIVPGAALHVGNTL